MLSKTVSGIMLVLLFVGMLTLALNIQLAKTEPKAIIVPDDYPTIQAAINSAIDEGTIFVKAGIYFENVVINKSICLVGEKREKTVIDGGSKGNVVSITVNNVTIRGFTIQNSGHEYYNSGISLGCSSDNTISDNVIRNNLIAIHIGGDVGKVVRGHNMVIGNSVVNNSYNGIRLWWSSYNTISHNIVTDSDWGILLSDSPYNVLSYNNLTGNWVGISMYAAPETYMLTYNNIFCNTIKENNVGFYLIYCYKVRVYHNNVIKNNEQVLTGKFGIVWDDGYPSGGNYWSDYNGLDLHSGSYQNETGSDVIGDTPYVIDENNVDHYPLMKLWTAALYELTVTSSPITGIPFTINGVNKTTPYTEWLPEGYYMLEMPETYNGYNWSRWFEDGDMNRIKTIYLHGTTWTGVYVLAAPPPPVGGLWVPINKLDLLRPWIALVSTILVATAATIIFIKYKKEREA
jgi:parallel beta-helix repeat protein